MSYWAQLLDFIYIRYILTMIKKSVVCFWLVFIALRETGQNRPKTNPQSCKNTPLSESSFSFACALLLSSLKILNCFWCFNVVINKIKLQKINAKFCYQFKIKWDCPSILVNRALALLLNKILIVTLNSFKQCFFRDFCSAKYTYGRYIKVNYAIHSGPS